MTTFNNGESLSSVRTKINEAIDKVDGNAAFNNGIDVNGNVSLGDNDELRLGDSDDLTIEHNATNGIIANNTNNLYLTNTANDKDVYIQSDDGSGGIANYFRADGSSGEAKLFYYGSEKLNTSSGGVDVTGVVSATSGFKFGTQEFFLYNSATDVATLRIGDTGSYKYLQIADVSTGLRLSSAGGNLQLGSGFNDHLSILSNGTVETVSDLNVGGNVSLGDNDELRLGDSDDLTIEHNATNGIIANNTNNLYLTNTANDKDVYIQSDDGSGGIANYFAADGSTGEAKMYYYGSAKVTTQSYGAHISGALTLSAVDPYIKLTDTSTGADHEIDANSGVGNLVINADINAEGSEPKLLLKVTGTTGITVRDTGNVDISGALSKGSGSFKIDHPLKPTSHHLVHSFVEAPQADNIYRGKVALVGGSATVNLDEAGRMTEGTFVALNGNIQCFTSNEDGWTAVRGSVSGNTLTVEAQDASCTDTVSWLVIGERHDQHMLDTDWTDAAGRVITEPEKQAEEEE